MKIYIVRHGMAEHSQRGVIAGWFNTELTELGKKQAEQLGNELINKKIDVIFSSDLKRASQTAEIISKKIKKDVIYDWLLRERYNGQLEGLKKEDVDWSEINSNQQKTTELGLEKIYQIDVRAKRFINNLKLFPKNIDNILIVSHNGYINNFLGVIDEKRQFRKIEHGEIIEFEN